MTLVSLPAPILYPGNYPALYANTFQAAAGTVSAAGHYLAYVFSAKENMTISHVGFRAGTATGSPTVEVRIETVDATGFPSGTLWAANTNGTTGTITSNTNVLQALTASASITMGQIFCVMLKYATGTSQVFTECSVVAAPNPSVLPYQVLNTGTPTKGSFTAKSAAIALGSSSTTFYYVPGTVPISSASTSTFNNTNSAKRGLKFTPPFNCRAIGVQWMNNTAVGDCNVGLYTGDASGTELSSSSTAFDGDHMSTAATGTPAVYFDNPVTLTAGTAYRVAIEPTTATNQNVTFVTLPSSDYFGATPGGANCVYTTLASGTWTDSTTQFPVMNVIIDQVDNGAGSGGVVGVIGG